MKKTAGISINLGILLVILLSFFTFSERFFPLLNSDMAVNILMTPSFSLPHHIYFWGQDRSGNLIPMLAHCLYIFTGWQPVVLVSIVHYLILAAGFWALMRFVKSGYGRFIVALVWFLPPWHFIEFLLILYGIQASCMILALNFLDRSFGTRVQWKCIAWLSCSCLMFIVAVWVSDMVLISLIAVLMTAVLYLTAARKIPGSLPVWRGLLIPAFCIVFWTFAGYLVLHYAKMISTPVLAYDKGFVADSASILSSLTIVITSVSRVFLFSSESNIESVFAWGFFVSLLFVIISKKQYVKTFPGITEKPWFYFFLCDALLTIIAVMSSSWVAANGSGRRYFTTFFISSFICLVLWLENLPNQKSKKIFQVALMIVMITGSLSGIFRFYYPEIKPSRIRVISALKSLGNIGIIAEYWNSYMSGSSDPVHIKTTPHEKDYVRNPDLVEEVLKQPKIYLIKDGWLDSFPDTIVQFRKTLRKKGACIHIADAWLNRYEIIKR